MCKVIPEAVIDSCLECQYNEGGECMAYSNGLQYMSVGIAIPEWCPLDDASKSVSKDNRIKELEMALGEAKAFIEYGYGSKPTADMLQMIDNTLKQVKDGEWIEFNKKAKEELEKDGFSMTLTNHKQLSFA